MTRSTGRPRMASSLRWTRKKWKSPTGLSNSIRRSTSLPGPRVAARDGAEEIKRSHPEPFELSSMLREPSQGFLARHDSIIGQPPNEASRGTLRTKAPSTC